MIDLETYGTAAGCPILSIGAIAFIHEGDALSSYTFYGVAHADQSHIGLLPDEATVQWWEDQSEEARAIFNDPNAMDIVELLTRFKEWLPRDAYVWGNGADFDNPILAHAYRAVGLPIPWKPYNGRCYRTIKNLAPSVKLERTGTHHNALDDAVCQAEHILRVVQALGLKLG